MTRPSLESRQAFAPPFAEKKRKRPDIIADMLRERMIEAGLQPGDRLPAEWLDPEQLSASRGTVREALKILEFQGMIASKTGPGGGIFARAVAPGEAIQTVTNLFLRAPPSISDIYALRKQLEPELAADAALHLPDKAIDDLQATIRLYEAEPKSADEEYVQRLAELDFHAELSRHAKNPVLGFACGLLLNLLRDLPECREIYQTPNPGLRETGVFYQIELIKAIRSRNPDRARKIMAEHMAEAEAYMLERARLNREAAAVTQRYEP
ncbi:FadR/GntR family transcriptional regulator [Martelella mediterranea]|uniref:Putative L-lactate dehydrogenase operon regulatory protein n=1 Tax=Martelella mediterranea DSM 17316 TaxID=1122214 RepID=A0A1U9YVI7_9HYPH|nr:FCD domain-containing protein [Martelella mediterranea]AQZ49410.1 Putative L-lactate dehydrogenase operon regulatory protein [Martelella mediterranea DSM 17316]